MMSLTALLSLKIPMTISRKASLKAINPLRMSDYKTVKIYEYTQGCFKSLDEWRDFMAKNLPGECNVEDIGAVEVG